MSSTKLRDRKFYNNFYWKLPEEMSREIMRYVDPIQNRWEKKDKKFIVKDGELKIKWCEHCGEYMLNSMTNADWVIMSLSNNKHAILYTCNNCKCDGVIIL